MYKKKLTKMLRQSGPGTDVWAVREAVVSCCFIGVEYLRHFYLHPKHTNNTNDLWQVNDLTLPSLQSTLSTACEEPMYKNALILPRGERNHAIARAESSNVNLPCNPNIKQIFMSDVLVFSFKAPLCNFFNLK